MNKESPWARRKSVPMHRRPAVVMPAIVFGLICAALVQVSAKPSGYAPSETTYMTGTSSNACDARIRGYECRLQQAIDAASR